jgi:hypothetical protein
MGGDILIIVNGSDSGRAVDEALFAARDSSRKAKALQILDSDLYHYGHNDLVAPRLNKQRFLLYIRELVLERGAQEAKRLREQAREMGVELEIDPVESEDTLATVLAEARKGYRAIYLAREKKKLFPLLQKHLATELRRQRVGTVVEC